MDTAVVPKSVQVFLNEFDYDNPAGKIPSPDSEICRTAQAAASKNFLSRWCGWFRCWNPTRRAYIVMERSVRDSLQDEVITAFTRGAKIDAMFPHDTECCMSMTVSKYSSMGYAARKSMHKVVLYLYLLGLDFARIDGKGDSEYALHRIQELSMVKLLVALGARVRKKHPDHFHYTPMESINKDIENADAEEKRERYQAIKQIYLPSAN